MDISVMAMKAGNQLGFVFEPRKARGGKRRGAGRKRSRSRPGVPHTTRPEHKARHPVHVTQRIAGGVLTGAGLSTLRRRDVYKILHRAFVHGCRRYVADGNFRICHFSVQRDHIHLVVEADSKTALSRGMQAFAIRVAKAINRFLGRRGQVFDDRYHAEVATNPRQTRNIVRYVILNARKHGEHTLVPLHWSATYVDPYSSARYFDGFTRDIGPPATDIHNTEATGATGTTNTTGAAPVAPAQTWLLRVGWRRHGLICPNATPGPKRS